ncbi:hypothetical protein DBA29_02490 [Xenophilus aerolatus]|nr:hypothetical protein [Xenophilus aerolatus]
MTADVKASPPEKSSRGRRVFVTVLVVLGVCEVLATSGLDLDMLPAWLAGAIAMIGFLTFLLLAGMFGNPLLAIALLFLAWRGWRWPFWRALLLSLPFWIVTARVLPGLG